MRTNHAEDKKRRLTLVIYAVLIGAALAFIWGNSLESIPVSREKSLGILKLVSPLIELFVGKGNVTDHLVRKLAHFCEYGFLGALLASFAVARRRAKLQSVANCLSFSLAVAVADEAIQILSNRGSQVSDVLLDFAGAAFGIMVALLAWMLIGKARNETPYKGGE